MVGGRSVTKAGLLGGGVTLLPNGWKIARYLFNKPS